MNNEDKVIGRQSLGGMDTEEAIITVERNDEEKEISFTTGKKDGDIYLVVPLDYLKELVK